eukprot:1434335-Karenia_brevis.AAC.1
MDGQIVPCCRAAVASNGPRECASHSEDLIEQHVGQHRKVGMTAHCRSKFRVSYAQCRLS